jgi:hypothetical protein
LDIVHDGHVDMIGILYKYVELYLFGMLQVVFSCLNDVIRHTNQINPVGQYTNVVIEAEPAR